MLYFPGGGSGGGGGFKPLSRPHASSTVGRPPPAADPRMRASLANAFAGSAFDMTSMRPGASGDPASPGVGVHRDAATSGVANRGASRGGGPSPYGVLVPRDQRPPRSSSGKAPPSSVYGGVQRPSQQYQQQMQRPSQRGTHGSGASSQTRAVRAGGPRARFPQNFPTHQPPARSGGIGGHQLSSTWSSGVAFSGGGRIQQQQQPPSQFDEEPSLLMEYASRPSPSKQQQQQQQQSPAKSSISQRGLGSMASAAREDEVEAAMAELNSLKGQVESDSRDTWRFAQAARPTTAPGVGKRPMATPAAAAATAANAGGGAAGGGAGSGGSGKAQVLTFGADDGGGGGGGSSSSAAAEYSAASRPGSAAPGGGAETEAELRLRLASAESVMRKLYRKTNDLQERLNNKDTPEGASSPGKDAAAGASSSADGGEGAISSAEREQALYMLQEKEADLQRMRDYTSQLAARLEHLASEQQRSSAARPSTAAGPSSRNDEYRDRYMRMRGEYRNLLRSRTDSVRKSGRIAQDKEHGMLIDQLDQALKEEAELHRKESQRLNEELYMQEKKSCDWYVEKRLLQDRLQALESEIGQRDQLEGQIDEKMLALFSRLKSLEDANVKLEQSNEELRTKAGVQEEDD